MSERILEAMTGRVTGSEQRGDQVLRGTAGYSDVLSDRNHRSHTQFPQDHCCKIPAAAGMWKQLSYTELQTTIWISFFVYFILVACSLLHRTIETERGKVGGKLGATGVLYLSAVLAAPVSEPSHSNTCPHQRPAAVPAWLTSRED